jgi:hypothetical protein
MVGFPAPLVDYSTPVLSPYISVRTCSKEIKVLNVTKEVSFLTLLIADSGQRNRLAFVVSN